MGKGDIFNWNYCDIVGTRRQAFEQRPLLWLTCRLLSWMLKKAQY